MNTTGAAFEEDRHAGEQVQLDGARRLHELRHSFIPETMLQDIAPATAARMFREMKAGATIFHALAVSGRQVVQKFRQLKEKSILQNNSAIHFPPSAEKRAPWKKFLRVDTDFPVQPLPSGVLSSYPGQGISPGEFPAGDGFIITQHPVFQHQKTTRKN